MGWFLKGRSHIGCAWGGTRGTIPPSGVRGGASPRGLEPDVTRDNKGEEEVSDSRNRLKPFNTGCGFMSLPERRPLLTPLGISLFARDLQWAHASSTSLCPLSTPNGPIWPFWPWMGASSAEAPQQRRDGGMGGGHGGAAGCSTCTGRVSHPMGSGRRTLLR